MAPLSPSLFRRLVRIVSSSCSMPTPTRCRPLHSHTSSPAPVPVCAPTTASGLSCGGEHIADAMTSERPDAVSPRSRLGLVKNFVGFLPWAQTHPVVVTMTFAELRLIPPSCAVRSAVSPSALLSSPLTSLAQAPRWPHDSRAGRRRVVDARRPSSDARPAQQSCRPVRRNQHASRREGAPSQWSPDCGRLRHALDRG